jgi:hypothetical protein
MKSRSATMIAALVPNLLFATEFEIRMHPDGGSGSSLVLTFQATYYGAPLASPQIKDGSPKGLDDIKRIATKMATARREDMLECYPEDERAALLKIATPTAVTRTAEFFQSPQIVFVSSMPYGQYEALVFAQADAKSDREALTLIARRVGGVLYLTNRLAADQGVAVIRAVAAPFLTRKMLAERRNDAK